MNKSRLSQTTKAVISSLTLVLAGAFSLPTSALSLPDVFSGAYRGEGQPTDLFSGPTAIIPRAINLMLFVVGVLAIFMIIYGGIRYVLSGGDNSRVKDAKNTVLYAIVGLIVAILGYALVQWVTSVVGSGATGGSNSSVGLLLTQLIV